MKQGTIAIVAAFVAVAVFGCSGSGDGGTDATSTGETSSALDSIAVGAGPISAAFGEGAVWVANFQDDTVTRVDPVTAEPRGTPIEVGDGPVSIATGHGVVWVANQYDGTVTRIDPASNRVVGAPTPSGDRPVALSVGAGSVWVYGCPTLAQAPPSPTRPCRQRP